MIHTCSDCSKQVELSPAEMDIMYKMYKSESKQVPRKFRENYGGGFGRYTIIQFIEVLDRLGSEILAGRND